MTHDELKTRIQDKFSSHTDFHDAQIVNALYRVVELHEPKYGDFPDEEAICEWCSCHDCNHIVDYPCKTIQKIEQELL